mgnify:CR=1 FL=1
MPSFSNDKIPIRRLSHWSTVTELAEGGFEVCGCPVTWKHPELQGGRGGGESQWQREHGGAAGRDDFLRNLYNEIEAFRYLPVLRDCSRHCGCSSEENRDFLPGRKRHCPAKHQEAVLKALMWVWFYAVFLKWEKLNSCFLPPFLGNRPVASRFFNELDVPVSLISGPQTWITAL